MRNEVQLSLRSYFHSLNLDIPNRHLTVYHTGDSDEVYQRHDRLKLDTSVVDTISADHGVLPDLIPDERKLLWSVLAINLFFFALELIMGFVSGSMGLVADGLEMLADSIVYGLAVVAVAETVIEKKNSVVLFLSLYASELRRF